ncbi:MAG: trypsin-like peptidase domain-containing protein [Chloroflexi bacterium]|nr:trypsin-like peptidase domain-containing protein [Chloroflexota bacterium]
MRTNTTSLRTTLLVIAVLVLAALLVMSNSHLLPSRTAEAAPSAAKQSSFQPVALRQNSVTPDQELLAALYDAALPSVVNIQVTTQPAADSRFGAPTTPQGGEGTGWVWDSQGHIVTNNHVVEDAQSILVNFANGMWADAELVARDPQADLAVIKVTPPNGMTLTPLTVADTSLRVGHYVIALGSPFGLDGTMTLGIVSALGRSFQVGVTAGTRYSLPEVIQTDAAINPGNSGGPLLNLQGEVVGINFAIRSDARSNAGVGFAIPVSVVRKVVPALIVDGVYSYSFLGISGTTIDAQVAAAENLTPNELGVFVAQAVTGGPSARAGVRTGDIVVRIDGIGVRSFEDLVGYLITETEPGQIVQLDVIRSSTQMRFDVELSARPGESAASTPNRRRFTVGEAIEIAKAAVAEANLMGEVDGATAKSDVRGGAPVWVVSLESGGKTATAVIDAVSGEVLDLTMDGG